MTDAQVKLPFRLIPRRSSAYAMALMVPAFGGFILASFLSDMTDDWTHRNAFDAIRDEPIFAIGFCIGLAVVLWMEFIALMQILPKSPLFHLEISATGIKKRHLFKEQSIEWAQIETLGIVQRLQRSGKSKRMHWWILSETKDWAADLDVDRRIKMARLAYDTHNLATPFGTSEDAAHDLLELLNQLKASAQGNKPDAVVTLAPSLRGVAVSVGPAAAARKSEATVAKPRRPSRSVIER